MFKGTEFIEEDCTAAASRASAKIDITPGVSPTTKKKGGVTFKFKKGASTNG